MLNKSNNNIASNQLRWVILLLAIAVILPTVCLLWFMTQAVKNERLAIRQQLIDSYNSRAQEIFFKFPEGFINDQNNFSASLILDSNDRIIFPVQSNQNTINLSETLQKGWKLEYSDKNFDQAIKQYKSIADNSSAAEVIYECQTAIARCLVKQNKISDAIEICRKLAYPDPNTINKLFPTQIARAKLMLVDLCSKTNHKELLNELHKQFSDSAKNIPTETKIFVLEELIKLAEKSGLTENLKTEIQNAHKFIDSASLSIMAADFLAKDTGLKSFPKDTFRYIKTSQPLYGIYFKTGNKNMLALLTAEKMFQFWQKSVDDFTDKLVFCRIYDDKGLQIAGDRTVEGELFSTLSLKNYFSGFKAELYLQAGVFKEAANRQMLIYIWVAVIVIGLMLISSLLAGRAVLRQAKLNRLKNDFIATVSHELKTPLSSMRVLVDSLLAGLCQTKQQETEYLQLISKENIRLSKLIDNFLTFSRMERNKQSFNFEPAAPAEIAKSAHEAVQTKFNKENCKLSVTIDDNLPTIRADKDAMTTVLVNLLDNAYKYSYDNKQVELNVFAENNSVCFTVKDNGIGMTRKQLKKIFDRFYQADTSLSRRAEGAGLGLSIVKFIVNAHKGKIEVESKPQTGSIFKVILPISLNQTQTI
jgi:signal transduction histidine kinase